MVIIGDLFLRKVEVEERDEEGIGIERDTAERIRRKDRLIEGWMCVSVPKTPASFGCIGVTPRGR